MLREAYLAASTLHCTVTRKWISTKGEGKRMQTATQACTSRASARPGRRFRLIFSRLERSICGSFLRRTRGAASGLTAEAEGIFLDYSKNRVTRRDAEAAAAAGGGVGAAGEDRRDVPRARRSTSRRIARCCMWRCGRRRARRSWWMARMWCRRCMRCWIRWRALPIACAAGTWKGHTGKRIQQRDQHRDRRLGPGAGDGV